MILVVGATGTLGMEICRLLQERGRPTRAIVRPGSSPEKVDRLRALGATIAAGDLKDPASLQQACAGIRTVISTASATISRREGDSIESVDRDGQLALISAAERSGVRDFVYVSFVEMTTDFPVQDAKRAVEQRLRRSSLGYTILRPANFMEVWLSPHLGFDPMQGRARIFGSGEAKVSWISFRDVAQFAVASVENPAAQNRIIDLGGPEALSPLEVVRIFEEELGQSISVEHVPEAALEAQRASAADSLQASLAGLALSTARGSPVPMESTLREFPVRLTTVREYARRLVHGTSPA